MLSPQLNDDLPLFQAYPRLGEHVARIRIGQWPTPVTEARHFAEAKGLRAFYVKREDRSHPECGGNKIRGLEFLLAEAQQRGAGTILTAGAVGSHHVCRTAWHARRLGMDTVGLVVAQPVSAYVRRNLMLGLDAGAVYVPANRLTLLPKAALQILGSGGRRGGRRPYLAILGGTSPLSCLGHVSAAMELAQQIEAGELPAPDYLYVALGSLGTAAGLVVGLALAGLRTRVVGVVVSYRWYCTAGRWRRLARRVLRLMRAHDPSVPEIDTGGLELSVVASALGNGYAAFTPASAELSRDFYASQRIRLDGTYTAKVLDGAMQYIHAGRLHDRIHLFWHTYQTARIDADSAEQVASLPARLRRYFVEDVQPLDGGFEDGAIASCGS